MSQLDITSVIVHSGKRAWNRFGAVHAVVDEQESDIATLDRTSAHVLPGSRTLQTETRARCVAH